MRVGGGSTDDYLGWALAVVGGRLATSGAQGRSPRRAAPRQSPRTVPVRP